MLCVLDGAPLTGIVMNEPPTHPKTSRLLALFLIVMAALSVTAIGGMYLASIAVHFVWLAVTKVPVRRVEDFPLWLWIPALAITVCLIWLASCLLKRLRVRERLMGDVGKSNSNQNNLSSVPDNS
jgi:hypothetical protein